MASTVNSTLASNRTPTWPSRHRDADPFRIPIAILRTRFFTARPATPRDPWAMRLARRFESWPLRCPNCGADLRIVAFITEATIGTTELSPLHRFGSAQTPLPAYSLDRSVSPNPPVGGWISYPWVADQLQKLEGRFALKRVVLLTDLLAARRPLALRLSIHPRSPLPEARVHWRFEERAASQSGVAPPPRIEIDSPLLSIGLPQPPLLSSPYVESRRGARSYLQGRPFSRAIAWERRCRWIQAVFFLIARPGNARLHP